MLSDIQEKERMGRLLAGNKGWDNIHSLMLHEIATNDMRCSRPLDVATKITYDLIQEIVHRARETDMKDILEKLYPSA